MIMEQIKLTEKNSVTPSLPPPPPPAPTMKIPHQVSKKIKNGRISVGQSLSNRCLMYFCLEIHLKMSSLMYLPVSLNHECDFFQEPKIPPPALKRPSYSNEVIPPPAIDLHPAPYESMGAEASTAFLAEDVRRFADLCNEIAFRLWTALTSKGDRHTGQNIYHPHS